MRQIGFSTGALARANFRAGLRALIAAHIPAVELSALRLEELTPLAQAIDTIDLSSFQYISVHAPSSFAPADENHVISVLLTFATRGWPIVVHPNVIFTVSKWKQLAGHLLIENMDRRKPIGRTADELDGLLRALPEAGVCFDLGHARQVDPTMIEARLIVTRFRDRIRQLHLSEVNERSQHDPISQSSIDAFKSIAALLPYDAPAILEPLVDKGQSDIQAEIRKAATAITATLIPSLRASA